ncbi:MAG: SIMPL domain-containing protein [bacterium]
MKKFNLLIIAACVSVSSFSQTKSFLDLPYIEVNGSADTLVTPDEIFIKITIAEADDKNKVSLESQERKMVAGLKTLGINTEKNLSMSDMQSNFKYYVLKQKDVMKTKEYTLKVGDAVLATKVFIKLEELGISNASVEKAGHSDIENLKNLCRTKAMINALQKANALTKPLQVTVGSPLHITDYSNDGEPEHKPMPMMRMQMMAMDDATHEKLPEINFEKIKISLSINVKFQLK